MKKQTIEMKRRTIGNRLNQLRKENKLTMEQAALKIMTNRATWCNWENDKSYPSLPMLMDICESFDVSSDWLLGLGGNV